MSATLPLWLDALVALLLVLGAVFALIGAVGLVRFDDFYKRVHGPTKAVTLGIGCVLLAAIVALSFSADQPGLRELLITLFIFLTAPIAAHMMVKAALKLDAPTRVAPPPKS
jgi:multicomponent K+:H+ antiporter subunit G